MNPLAVMFILIGGVLLIVAFRNNQDNLISGLAGKPFGSSSLPSGKS